MDAAQQAPSPPEVYPGSYRAFLAYLESRYPGEAFTPEDMRDKFDSVFMMGLNQANRFKAIGQAHKFMFNGRVPRKDMMVRLGLILGNLKASCRTYPSVPPVMLRTMIARVVGRGQDKRYINKYQDWIVSMATRNIEFNRVDLSYLEDNFPSNLICVHGADAEPAGGAGA